MTHLHQRSKNLSRDLSRFVGSLSEGVSEKGVHCLRTTIRRLETVIHHSASKPGTKQEKALKELRALRKRAGKVRDVDIQMGLLSAIGNGSASADRRLLTEALKKKRAKQVSRLAAATKEMEGSKLFNRLARIRKNAAAEQADSTATLEHVRQELMQLSAGYSAAQPLKPARLHELRIKLKLLRYESELAAETPEQKNLAEELKSVQDSIGEWHDWEMLAESAEELFEDRINCALLIEIRSLLAARFSAATTATLNLLTACIPPAKKKPASVPTARSAAQSA